MRLLWGLVKAALVVALVVPVAIIVLGTALGLFGALLGLAFLVLRFAVFGLIAWGLFRLAAALFRSPASHHERIEVRELPKPDPHYEAAMRELDRELGPSR